MKNNKLSFTKLSTYESCSLQYKLHYLDYIRPIKPRSALIFGNSIDEALNVLLETRDLNKAQNHFEQLWSTQKFNGKDLQLSDPGVVQFSKADTDENLLEINQVSTDNRPWFSLLLKAELILKAYYQQVLPKIKKVIVVQKPVKIENAEGDTIEGKLDLIVEWYDGRILLMDNKTTSVKYEANSANESKQLNLYYYLEKEAYNLDAIGFITINKNLKWHIKKTCKVCKNTVESKHKTCPANIDKKKCNGEFHIDKTPEVVIEYIINDVTDEQQDIIIEAFNKVNYGISNEIYEENRNSCIGKYGKCVYYDLCNKDSMEGLEKLQYDRK